MSLIQFCRGALPVCFYPFVKSIHRSGLQFFYWGRRRVCPCCGGHFRKFRAFGTPLRIDALCPVCGSLERQRLLWLFLKNSTPFFDSALSVLHVAPSAVLKRAFQKLPHRYITVDLVSPLAQIRSDVTCLAFGADYFDAILCNHVLEHVFDDRAAMAELWRVLKPGGWAILQVPIDLQRAETLEVENLDALSFKDRLRLFGQADHVRQYGCDYATRLCEAGFDVQVIDFTKVLGQENIIRYGLMSDEQIFFCKKPVIGKRDLV